MSESAFEKNKSVSDLHRFSDVDSSWHAQHHTLGAGVNQASPGNHTHDGSVSKRLTGASIEDFSMQSPARTPISIDLSTVMTGSNVSGNQAVYDAANERVVITCNDGNEVNFGFNQDLRTLIDPDVGYFIEAKIEAPAQTGSGATYWYFTLGDNSWETAWIYLNMGAVSWPMGSGPGYHAKLMHPQIETAEQDELNNGIYIYLCPWFYGNGTPGTYYIYEITFWEIGGHSFTSDEVAVTITKPPNAEDPKFVQIDSVDMHLDGLSFSDKVTDIGGNATRLNAFNLKQYQQSFFNNVSTLDFESSYNYFNTYSFLSGMLTLVFTNIPVGSFTHHYYLEVHSGITSISWPAGTKFAGGAPSAPSGRTIYELIANNGQVIVNRIMIGIA